MIPSGRCLRVTIRADIGFLNENVPLSFFGLAVHVILLAETSDGRKVHFMRLRSYMTLHRTSAMADMKQCYKDW